MKYVVSGFIIFLLACCASSRRDQRSMSEISTLDTSSVRGELSASRVEAITKNLEESFRNFIQEKNAEKKVTNFSAPDSTGHQYITSQEEYRSQNKTSATDSSKSSMENYINKQEEYILFLKSQVEYYKNKKEDISVINESRVKYWRDISIVILVSLIILSASFIYFKKKYGKSR